MPFQRRNIFFLTKRFAFNAPALVCKGNDVIKKFRDEFCITFLCKVDGISYAAAVNRLAAAQRHKQLVRNHSSKFCARIFPFNVDAIPFRTDMCACFILDDFQVFIEHAKKADHFIH